MTSIDSSHRTARHIAPEGSPECEQQTMERLADLQRIVATLLEKNEELRRQLVAQRYRGSEVIRNP